MEYKIYPINFINPKIPRIAIIRENKGMPPSDLAKKMGITKSYLSKIEAGERKLSPMMAKKASEILECDPEVLIDKGKGDLVG